jgi:D-alanine-D-alanine ligase-like ATP-grasp enzyme
MVLEANPNPDISPSSGFLRSVRAAGLDYPEFIRGLIDEALHRS